MVLESSVRIYPTSPLKGGDIDERYHYWNMLFQSTATGCQQIVIDNHCWVNGQVNDLPFQDRPLRDGMHLVECLPGTINFPIIR